MSCEIRFCETRLLIPPCSRLTSGQYTRASRFAAAIRPGHSYKACVDREYLRVLHQQSANSA